MGFQIALKVVESVRGHDGLVFQIDCFCGKKVGKMRIFAAILRPFSEGRQEFAGERATWPAFPCKISSQ